jgi:hypothetical protein
MMKIPSPTYSLSNSQDHMILSLSVGGVDGGYFSLKNSRKAARVVRIHPHTRRRQFPNTLFSRGGEDNGYFLWRT